MGFSYAQYITPQNKINIESIYFFEIIRLIEQTQTYPHQTIPGHSISNAVSPAMP